MSNVEVRLIGIREILRHFRFIRSGLSDPGLFAEIGLFLTFKIESRTAEGKDVDETNFLPYSDSYALKRVKAGRSARVNLFWSGSMMSALTFENDRDSVRLFFQNTSDPNGVSNPSKAFFLNQDRRFFAISDQDREETIRIIRSHIRRLTRRRR